MVGILGNSSSHITGGGNGVGRRRMVDWGLLVGGVLAQTMAWTLLRDTMVVVTWNERAWVGKGTSSDEPVSMATLLSITLVAIGVIFRKLLSSLML